MSTANRAACLLSIFAEQCGEKLSLNRTTYLLDRLNAYEPDRVCRALETLLETTKRFPTFGEIKNAMGEQSSESKGREVGERIWGAICKYGSTDWKRVADFIGPIGAEVVRLQGGWRTICDMATFDNAGQLKAQWRELATIVAARGPQEHDVAPNWALPTRRSGPFLLLGGKSETKID